MTILETCLAALLSAVLSGAGSVMLANHRLNSRITGVELKIVEKFVSKEDLNVSFAKFEEHLIRIESKFDQLLLNTRNGRQS